MSLNSIGATELPSEPSELVLCRRAPATALAAAGALAPWKSSLKLSSSSMLGWSTSTRSS